MARVGQQGVTLVDVLVSMLLLNLALLALSASVPYAMYGVVVAGFQSTATFLAQQSIEGAKNTGYGDLPALDTGGFEAVPSYEGFQRSVAVAVATPTAQTTTVTVAVRFTGPTNPGADTTYETGLATVLAE